MKEVLLGTTNKSKVDFYTHVLESKNLNILTLVNFPNMIVVIGSCD